MHDVDTERPRDPLRARRRASTSSSATSSPAATASTASAARASRAGVLSTFEREYPFGWLGILAAVAPSIDELVYAHHERGFALLSLRSPELSRYYVQCRAGRAARRLARRAHLGRAAAPHRARGLDARTRGRCSRRASPGMRSFVVEPMQYGRLFLAGDAAHIVPPTGAKGLNLAIADVRVLAEAIVDWYASGATTALDSYSEHVPAARLARGALLVVDDARCCTGSTATIRSTRGCSSRSFATSRRSAAAATSLAENYVGLTTL